MSPLQELRDSGANIPNSPLILIFVRHRRLVACRSRSIRPPSRPSARERQAGLGAPPALLGLALGLGAQPAAFLSPLSLPSMLPMIELARSSATPGTCPRSGGA